MAWILPIIAFIVSLIIIMVVVLLAGYLVPPIYDQVMNSQEVANVGFQQGAETAARIGLRLVPAAMLLALIFWLMFLRLRQDQYKGQFNRR